MKANCVLGFFGTLLMPCAVCLLRLSRGAAVYIQQQRREAFILPEWGRFGGPVLLFWAKADAGFAGVQGVFNHRGRVWWGLCGEAWDLRLLDACSVIAVCFRSLEEALVCLRTLLPETTADSRLDQQASLLILVKTASSDSRLEVNWSRWKEGLDLTCVLPRIAVLVEASDPVVLRRKSAFFYQALRLSVELIETFGTH
ncbi:hypothetical protein cyc_00797 [Cyclospora cayetanensis]|uniref:Uncharacterized protein n=1 Tax=Cyclospora cayetanensis TaxID=88456 RepID=A0A1D3D8B4_9EIME|nr:hypothetical protein cyc_00797 [Cyclospora cayetanensis]